MRGADTTAMNMSRTFERYRQQRLSPAMIYPVLDWFIPASDQGEQRAPCSARACSSSAIFSGRSSVIPSRSICTCSIRRPNYALWVLAASISLFLSFPFALKWTGWYKTLAVLSVQNLIFAILWGCYHYGGLSSPFLPWLLTVPLLAFFYLGSAAKQRLLVLSLIACNFGGFYLAYAQTHSFPAAYSAFGTVGHRHHFDALRGRLCVDHGALLRQHRRLPVASLNEKSAVIFQPPASCRMRKPKRSAPTRRNPNSWPR